MRFKTLYGPLISVFFVAVVGCGNKIDGQTTSISSCGVVSGDIQIADSFQATADSSNGGCLKLAAPDVSLDCTQAKSAIALSGKGNLFEFSGLKTKARIAMKNCAVDSPLTIDGANVENFRLENSRLPSLEVHSVSAPEIVGNRLGSLKLTGDTSGASIVGNEISSLDISSATTSASSYALSDSEQSGSGSSAYDTYPGDFPTNCPQKTRNLYEANIIVETDAGNDAYAAMYMRCVSYNTFVNNVFLNTGAGPAMYLRDAATMNLIDSNFLISQEANISRGTLFTSAGGDFAADPAANIFRNNEIINFVGKAIHIDSEAGFNLVEHNNFRANSNEAQGTANLGVSSTFLDSDFFGVVAVTDIDLTDDIALPDYSTWSTCPVGGGAIAGTPYTFDPMPYNRCGPATHIRNNLFSAVTGTALTIDAANWTTSTITALDSSNTINSNAGCQLPPTRANGCWDCGRWSSASLNGYNFRSCVSVPTCTISTSSPDMVRTAAASDPDTTAPAAPTGVSASVVGSNVGISWIASSSSDVTAYVIYRLKAQTGQVHPSEIALVDPRSTSWTDSSVPAGGYVYQVAARDAAGNRSARSALASALVGGATTADVTPPSHPTNLTATAVSSSQINLTWTAATDDVGVVGYDIYRIGGQVNGNGNHVGTTTSTSFSDTGLLASTRYEYTVVARDAAGNLSDYPNIQVLTTPASTSTDTTAPSAPSGLAANAVSTSEIDLTWIGSTDNVGVVAYDVYRGGVKVGSSIGTSYSDTGLLSSTEYTYSVKARDAAGNLSAASGTASATTLVSTDSQAPTIPTDLTATAAGSTQIDLTWTASTDNVGVIGYKIYRAVGSSTTFSFLAQVTGSNASDTGLTPNTTYTYKVSAIDARPNESSMSTPASATTSPSSGASSSDLSASQAIQISSGCGVIGSNQSEWIWLILIVGVVYRNRRSTPSTTSIRMSV